MFDRCLVVFCKKKCQCPTIPGASGGIRRVVWQKKLKHVVCPEKWVLPMGGLARYSTDFVFFDSMSNHRIQELAAGISKIESGVCDLSPEINGRGTLIDSRERYFFGGIHRWPGKLHIGVAYLAHRITYPAISQIWAPYII